MRHLMLALLSQAPSYGLELKQQHDELVGVVAGAVNVGQIYTTLGRMEDKGLVRHEVHVSDVGPERKVYELTDDGEKELRVWLESPPAPPELKSDALSKIVAALQLDHPSLPELTRAHRGQCLEALRALDMAAAEAGDSRALHAVVQAAALHLQADLQWLDHIDRLAAQPSHGDGGASDV